MNLQSDSLRIVFAGTPPFAAHHLQALIASHHQVLAVYTQPDRPAGRGRQLTASPVKKLALTHGIDLYQPESLKDKQVQQQLAGQRADVMVVVAYGLLLPPTVLAAPRFGCLNVHASLLPCWRGAAPIQRAIAAGDTVSGVTVMQMDAGMDTGAVWCQRECGISADETAASLHDKLLASGVPALLETLARLRQGDVQPVPQNDALATYAPKISKAEALVNWSLPAPRIDRCIRAYQPFPVSYTLINRQRIKLFKVEVRNIGDTSATNKTPQAGEILAFDETALSVACGSGALAIKALQLPGKKVMTAGELLNGYRHLFPVGQCFEW